MIAFSCPGCRATFNLPDEAAGKTARCSRCNQRFSVPAGAGQASLAPALKPAATTGTASPKKVALNPIPGVLEAQEVVDEPAVPRRAAKLLDDVEVVDDVDQVEVVEDEAVTERRPPVRSSRQDDDDDYDAPRRGKRRRKKSSSSMGLIIGCIVGGMVLVGVIVVVIVILANRPNAQVNAGAPPEVKFNGGGNAGNPAANNAGPGVVLDRRDQLTRGDAFDTQRPGCRAKRYTVRLEANRSYKIDMMANNRIFGDPFDPFIRVEFNGITVAQDDDGGGGNDNLDASLIFRPQQTGDYVIIATSFDPQIGGYRLLVTALP